MKEENSQIHQKSGFSSPTHATEEYGFIHVQRFCFLVLFKMIAAPRPAARTKLQKAATTSSALSAMFRYTTNTGKVTRGSFMHANKSSDFASMVDFGENDTTSLRPAG